MNRIVCTIAVALVLFVAGCKTSFPYGASLDRHNFLSTPSNPLSLALEDAITGEELLRIDVPVGKMLVIDFERRVDWAPAQTPGLPAHRVEWDIVEPDRVVKAYLSNGMDLPGNPVRMRMLHHAPVSVADANLPRYQPQGGRTGGGPAVQSQPEYIEQGGGPDDAGARPATDREGMTTPQAEPVDRPAPPTDPTQPSRPDQPADPSDPGDMEDRQPEYVPQGDDLEEALD